MKAVLLAGGRGERLAPLTDTTPKPLVRVLDTPVIEYALAHLSALGVREAAVTLCYRAEDVRRTLGTTVHGVRLTYLEETVPLGTAGALLELSDFLDEDFLVLSGDALFDFDLGKAVSFHREKGALATLVLTEKEDVGEYGVVRVSEDFKILAFSEKPTWQGVFSPLVNCGIYVLSPEVLQYVGTPPFDFSHDLFPRLLEEGRGLYGVSLSGYWCDIGSPASLYRCNLDALDARVRLPLPARGRFVGDGESRAFLGEGVRLSSGARVERSVIGARTALSFSHVTDCVLGRDCVCREGTRLAASLVADRAVFEKNSVLSASCVVGEGAHFSGSCITPEGSVIPSFTKSSSSAAPFGAHEELFSYSAHTSAAPKSVLRARFYRLGAAIAQTLDSPLFCTAENAASESLFASLQAGATDTGRAFSVARVSSYSAACYGAITLSRPALFFSFDEKSALATLRLTDAYGLPLSSGIVRRIERAFYKESQKLDGFFCPGDVTDLVENAYFTALVSHLPERFLWKISVADGALSPLFSRALLRAGAKLCPPEEDGALKVSFDSARGTVAFSDDVGVFADDNALRTLLLTRGKETFSVHFARGVLSKEAVCGLASRGVSVKYPVRADGVQDEVFCRASISDAFYYDPLLLSAAALSYFYALTEGEEDLLRLRAEAASLSPNCVREREFVFPKEESARLFSRLWETAKTEEGLCLKSEGGDCHLYPEHGRVLLRASANSPEAAEELCDFTVQQLQAFTENKEN